MQNGIPFWYFHDHGGALGRHAGAQRSTRNGALLAGIPVRPGARLRGLSGVRTHRPRRGQACRRRSLPAGRARRQSISERAHARSPRLFARAGFKAPVLDNIRAEIWLKLWGNLTFNPISALSHCHAGGHLPVRPPRASWPRQMMTEAQTVAGKLGITVPRAAGKAHRRVPRRSASTRPRCCRTWKRAAPPRSTRWSARSSNWAG